MAPQQELVPIAAEAKHASVLVMVRGERFHREPDVRIGDIHGTQVERVVESLIVESFKWRF